MTGVLLLGWCLCFVWFGLSPLFFIVPVQYQTFFFPLSLFVPLNSRKAFLFFKYCWQLKSSVVPDFQSCGCWPFRALKDRRVQWTPSHYTGVTIFPFINEVELNCALWVAIRHLAGSQGRPTVFGSGGWCQRSLERQNRPRRWAPTWSDAS